MTFTNVATLGAARGKRDELVALLTERSNRLREFGCSSYEVGVSDDEPDSVFVVEMWVDRAAHPASLDDPEVSAAISAARPLLSDEFSGLGFDVVGSPLRD